MMILFEIYYALRGKVSPMYAGYQKVRQEREEQMKAESQETVAQSDNSNAYSLRVMGRAITCSSLLILVIAAIADSGQYIIVPIGVILLLVGLKLAFKKIEKK